MKRIWVGIIVGSMLVSAKAQTIKEIFISLPEVALLPLSTNDRMDLIDLYTEGREASIQNSFGDTVILNRLEESYLSIQSGNATTEIFFLTLVNESKIIGLIQTVCAPICDSRLEFYSLKWKKLNPDLFTSPVGRSWFVEEEPDFLVLDIALMKFHYDPEKQHLSQMYNTSACVSAEEQKVTTENAGEKIKIYQWNGLRFE
jgi:hypothetical protein